MNTRKSLTLTYRTRGNTALAAAIDAMKELYGTDVNTVTAALLEYMMAPMTAALSGASRSEVDVLIEKSLARARLHLESARLHLPCDEIPEKVAEPFADQEASCLSSQQEDSSPADEEFDYSKPIGVFDDDY